jgi:hypothetical protein
MTSQALQTWLSSQRRALDRFDELRSELGGLSSESRRLVQQIDDVYILLLAAHFQLFCRSLHEEASNFVASWSTGPEVADLVRRSLVDARKLDRGNAHPMALRSDFKRFGFELWEELIAYHPANANRRTRLGDLNKWRNSIAHQSFRETPSIDDRERRTIQSIRIWRHDCDVIASQMDIVVRRRLSMLTGAKPW